MALRSSDIVATLILNLIHCAYTTDHIRHCSVYELDQCLEHQICNQTSGVCDCMQGYTQIGDECEVPPPAAHHGATAAVVTLFTLALVICGLVLLIRKYNLVEYVCQKINIRRNNDTYEDVMIGQDDPPLSP